LRLATMVAVWVLLILPACTENCALLDPADTVTDVGTLNGA